MAAATAGTGIAALLHVKDRRETLLAAVPLLFAVQQSIEGTLWLELAGGNEPARVGALAFAYLIFAKVLWPTYIGLAVLAVEPNGNRRRPLAAMDAYIRQR